MSHLVEIINGVAQLAYAGERCWHGLGTKVGDDMTPSEILKVAGLDWNVNAVPAFAEIGGERVPVGRSALVRDRDNKILDVITDDWKPMQNADAFEFFTEFVNEGDMAMEVAGSLKGGKVVWGLAKVKESFELFGGDRVDSYLLFTNPHTYGQSIDVRFTPTRVVCNNTLTLALNSSSKQMVKVSHRRDFDADLVKQTLGIAKSKLDTYKDMAEFLGAKRFTQESLRDYFMEVFPVVGVNDNTKKEISKSAKMSLEIISTQPGAEFAEGSFWSAFNAVTFMTNHVIGRTADARISSAWYGQNRTLNTRALELAVEYANAA